MSRTASGNHTDFSFYLCILIFQDPFVLCRRYEIGIGHHGEPGIEVAPLESAEQIARRMCDVILPDLPFKSGDEVVVLVSGLGSTPLMEQYILYGEVEKILESKGIKVHKSLVGNYFTSLEMAGATLSVMRLDDELKECFDYEADAVSFKQF